MRRTVAILPVKRFGRAKQRLTGGFPDRPGLAAAMVADVLDALAQVQGLDEVLVVTAAPVRDPRSDLQASAAWRGRQPAAAAEAIEARPGVVIVHDAEEAGQSAAAKLGIAAAVERGAERVLLVPGDCPALDPDEVRALLDCDRASSSTTHGGVTRRSHETAGDAHVVIVPDRHGTGTNALLLAPPTVMEPAFGEGSFARHTRLARAAGVEPRVAEVRSLGLDVDTPDDLAALRRALAAWPGGAVRTRALLGEAAVA